MKISLYLYKFLIIVLTFSIINPILVSTLKVSKALNKNVKAKEYLYKKINNLPIYLKPIASKIFISEKIYQKFKYTWPSTDGLPSSIFYLTRWSLFSFLLLIISLIKKKNLNLFFERLINLYLEKSSYSKQSKFFVLFIFFAFFSWILKLQWGFWNPGISGWNMNYSQSLIPIEDFKVEKNGRNKSFQCLDLKKDYLLNAIDTSKLPSNNFLRKKSKTSDYVIKTNFYLAKASGDLGEISLISDGMFGFIFPRYPIKSISRNGVNQLHIDILNLRLKNYDKFKGPFRIPFKFAYPVHTPYNKNFTNYIKNINYIASLNVLYKINLESKKVSVLDFNILSEYPNCL